MYLIHDPFFRIAASVADIAADNLNGIKIFLAKVLSKLFINGETTVIDNLGKFRNPPSWLVIFLVVPLNKIPLFSIDLITFITSFISLFVRVFPKPAIDENAFLIFLPIKLSTASTKVFLLNFWYPYSLIFSLLNSLMTLVL